MIRKTAFNRNANRARRGQAILWAVIIGFALVAALLIALLLQGQNQQAAQQAATDLTIQVNGDSGAPGDDSDDNANVVPDTDNVSGTDSGDSGSDDQSPHGQDADNGDTSGNGDGDGDGPDAPPSDTPDQGDGNVDTDPNDNSGDTTDALSAIPDPGSVDGGQGYTVGRDNNGNIINIFIVNSAGVVISDITQIIASLKVAGQAIDNPIETIGNAITDAAATLGGEGTPVPKDALIDAYQIVR